jgi:Helix-turn-helix domain
MVGGSELKFNLSDIMSPSEAAERWGLKRNTVIAALTRGRFDEQIEKGLVKKYVKETGQAEWYLTTEAMNQIFGGKNMAKVYYEDILVGEVLTNRSLSVEEALDLIGFDEAKFIADNGFDDIDYNDFKLVY